MQNRSVTRREFLFSACVAAGALHGSSLLAMAAPESAQVQTPLGLLRGEVENGVRIFRGVPFAQPPVGALRFRPPIKPQAWTGVRDATRFAASAMQTGEPGIPHSEDCLYLNLWAPERKGSFPVYVWVHGGGFTGGRSFDPLYDGAAFAQAGIVCVTVAYRLGVFGFLDLAPLLGAEYAGSANNALLDLIAALAWVQENISAFGGDPARVTVGGESAGAKLTGLLMGIPAAQPLFHQMISESGGAERVAPMAQGLAVARGFGETWQKREGAAGAAETHDLRTAPAAGLIEAQHAFLEEWPQHFPLRAEIDGTLLPRLPVEKIATGSTRGKRLLIGTNRDESALFIGPHPAHDPDASQLGNISTARFAEVFRHYQAIYPDLTVEQQRIRALTAEEYWVPSMRVVDAHVKGGGSAWMYRLDFVESSGRLKDYAYHSLDTGMVWGKPHASVDNAAAEAALGTQMHQAWVAFIRGEPPSAPGLPAWTEYSTSTRPTMILDTQSRVEQRPQEAELRLWDGVL